SAQWLRRIGPLRSSSADSTEASAAAGSSAATAHARASLEVGASACTAHRSEPRRRGRSSDPPPPQAPLQAFHLAAVHLVVVAEAVQQAVEQQHLDLARRIA